MGKAEASDSVHTLMGGTDLQCLRLMQLHSRNQSPLFVASTYSRSGVSSGQKVIMAVSREEIFSRQSHVTIPFSWQSQEKKYSLNSLQ